MRQEWLDDVAQVAVHDPGFKTMTELLAMPFPARRAYDRSRRKFLRAGSMIETVAARTVFSEMKLLLKADETGASDANDMFLVTGPSGVGKSKVANTTAVWWYFECVTDEMADTGATFDDLTSDLDFVPVVRITLPGAVTPRELFELICEFLDRPVAVTLTNLRRTAEAALRESGTRLLVVDEVQALRFSGKSSRDTYNTLRHLVNISSLSLMLVGHNMLRVLDTPIGDADADSAREVIRGRLTDFEIGPFLHGTQERWDEWVGVLEILEGRFRLANAEPGWLSQDLAELVFQTTLGHFKSLISLLSRANVAAIDSGEEAITREILDATPIERMNSAKRRDRIALFDRGQWHFLAPSAS